MRVNLPLVMEDADKDSFSVVLSLGNGVRIIGQKEENGKKEMEVELPLGWKVEKILMQEETAFTEKVILDKKGYVKLRCVDTGVLYYIADPKKIPERLKFSDLVKIH